MFRSGSRSGLTTMVHDTLQLSGSLVAFSTAWLNVGQVMLRLSALGPGVGWGIRLRIEPAMRSHGAPEEQRALPSPQQVLHLRSVSDAASAGLRTGREAQGSFESAPSMSQREAK